MATKRNTSNTATKGRVQFNPESAGHGFGAFIGRAVSAMAAARQAFREFVKRRLSYDEWSRFTGAIVGEVMRGSLLELSTVETEPKRKQALANLATLDDAALARQTGGRDANPTLVSIRKGRCESALQAVRKEYRNTFATKGSDGKMVLAEIPKKSAGERKAGSGITPGRALNALHSTLESLIGKAKYDGTIPKDLTGLLMALIADAQKLDALVTKRIADDKAAAKAPSKPEVKVSAAK